MRAYLVENDGEPIAKLSGKKKYIGIIEKENNGPVNLPPDLLDVSERKKKKKDPDEMLDDYDEKEFMMNISRAKNRHDDCLTYVITRAKLSYIPNMETRENLYIAGPAGSGKSYFAAAYATKYSDLFQNPIYLFSTKDEDKILDDIKGLERIPLNDKWLETDFDYNMFKNSLCIFDDVDSLETNKPLAAKVWGLRDTLLQNARSNNTYTISTIHNAFGYRATRTSLQEAHLVVFFPGSGNDHHVRKYLKERVGLKYEMVEWIMTLQSRWIGIHITMPRFIIWEYGVKII